MLHLLCEVCGATETVADYGQGERPARFELQPKLAYGWARMRFHTCGDRSEAAAILGLNLYK